MVKYKRHNISVTLTGEDLENYNFLSNEIKRFYISISDAEVMKTALRGYTDLLRIFDNPIIEERLKINKTDSIAEKAQKIISYLENLVQK